MTGAIMESGGRESSELWGEGRSEIEVVGHRWTVDRTWALGKTGVSDFSPRRRLYELEAEGRI